MQDETLDEPEDLMSEKETGLADWGDLVAMSGKGLLTVIGRGGRPLRSTTK